MYSSYGYSSGDTVGVYVGYLLGSIIVCVIFGVICDHIVKNKGYDGGGFLWGFFLTWIGVIVCALKPEAPSSKNRGEAKGLSYSGLGSESRSAAPRPVNDSWICNCGARNGDAYTTCYRCGKNRYEKTVLKPVYAASTSPSLEKKNVSADDTASQIKDFKKLLDDGLITEEEFAAKKKQILGI